MGPTKAAERDGQRGNLPQGLRVQGASSTNIKILFIDSLDLFKESFDHRCKRPNFVVLPMGFGNLLAALGPTP